MLQYPILIVYSMSMHNGPSTATHTYCDARAHNRSIAIAHCHPACADHDVRHTRPTIGTPKLYLPPTICVGIPSEARSVGASVKVGTLVKVGAPADLRHWGGWCVKLDLV